MRRFGLIFGGLALAAVVAGAGFAQAQGAFADVIAARQAGMKKGGANLGAIKMALDAGGDLAAVAPLAQEIADLSAKLPGMFPPGSGKESGTKTRALPAIWANKADFDMLAGNRGTASAKLVAALKANDAVGAKAAFAETGGACGACHRTYQEKLAP